MVTRDQFVAQVRSLLVPPVPYVHAGRTRHGIDCVGVLTLPLTELGESFRDVPNYTREAYRGSLPAALVGAGLVEVAVADRLPGDALVMWWDRATKEPQHVAVQVVMPTGEPGIVHCYQDVGRCVENHLGVWRRRVTHVLRLPPSILSP